MRTKDNIKPEFICIGMPKTATTWMYSVLKHHDQVDLPPVKEISYFRNRGFNYRKGFIPFIFHKDWYNKKKRVFFNKIFQSKNPNTNKPFTAKERWWIIRYCLFRNSNKWYRSLFINDSNLRSIDFSPVYSYLNETSIQKIRTQFPDTQIILSLRNPIDRAWSNFKMVKIKEEREVLNNISIKEAEEYYQHQLKYSNLVKKWKRYYDPTNFHLVFYEDLVNDPMAFYQSICKILMIDPGKLKREGYYLINKKSNKGLEREIPVDHKKILMKTYRDDITYLNKICPHQIIKSWLNYYL